MFRILAKHLNYKRLYVVYNALTVFFIFLLDMCNTII